MRRAVERLRRERRSRAFAAAKRIVADAARRAILAGLPRDGGTLVAARPQALETGAFASEMIDRCLTTEIYHPTDDF